MARFRCRACGQEDTFVYSGRHDCPRCGCRDVQFASGVEELLDDDLLVEALARLAETEPTETDD